MKPSAKVERDAAATWSIYDTAQLRQLLIHIRQGTANMLPLRQKRSEVTTARVHLDADHSVVVKLWNYRGSLAWARHVIGSSGPSREWNALYHLYAAGVTVPAPLGFFHDQPARCEFTDAVFLTDLGDCIRVSEHARSLYDEQHTSALRALEERIIEMTVEVQQAGLLDIDHTMMNFLITNDGQPARVDLEFARHVSNPAMRPRLWGSMLGRLLGTYGICVHADFVAVQQFRGRLLEATRPSRSARDHADRVSAQILQRHRAQEKLQDGH